MTSNKNRVALVTGASRGIGSAIAVELGRRGFHVLINFLSAEQAAQDTLEEVKKEGGSGELIRFNVTDEEETNKTIEAWQKLNNEKVISVLVNNAGIRKDNLLLWQTTEDWSSVININLNGFFNVTRAVLK